jgi:4-amino-4-deoxy-L-arabinose transferase-like glycosyltransferase
MKTSPESLSRPPSPSHRTAVWATAIILAASAVLLFARLGHYALWDDEAITAMTARGVWRTGDTSAWVDDHNLLAYRNGLLIKNFKDRYTPPLQFYLIAPFIGLLGQSNFVCRLPFAICGLITVGILLRWLWRSRPPPLVWWAAAIVILTNASFFLFFRQCRYYGLASVLTLAVAYQYWYLGTRRRSVVWISLTLVTLLTAQYLNFAAAVGCLVVDYAVWGRHRRPLDWKDWLILIVPQIVVGAIVCSIWNPLAMGATADSHGSWIVQHFHLLVWNWRDMIASDFIILPLLILCPLMYFSKRNQTLLRAPAALIVYIAIIAAAAAGPPTNRGNAEVRYLAPLLPLCIAISILTIWALEPLKPKIKWTVLAIAALTVLLEPDLSSDQPAFGPTSLLYYRELISPQQEPYTPMAQWINAHVPAGASVYVSPEWMASPLMFYAPKAIYAWQLTDPPKPEYVGLPDIFFKYRVAPDYMFACGPWAKEISEIQSALAARKIRYEQIDTIHVYWKDMFRPERIWRSFVTIHPKPGEEIYIFRRIADGPINSQSPTVGPPRG